MIRRKYINKNNSCLYVVMKECKITDSDNNGIDAFYYRELLDNGKMHGHYVMEKEKFLDKFKCIDQ